MEEKKPTGNEISEEKAISSLTEEIAEAPETADEASAAEPVKKPRARRKKAVQEPVSNIEAPAEEASQKTLEEALTEQEELSDKAEEKPAAEHNLSIEEILGDALRNDGEEEKNATEITQDDADIQMTALDDGAEFLELMTDAAEDATDIINGENEEASEEISSSEGEEVHSDEGEDTAKEDEEMYSLNFFEDEEKPAELEEPDQTETDDEKKELPPYNPKSPRRIDTRFDFVELFVFTLVAVMIITSFFFRHSIVEGESMENTLYNGEHLIISDLFYKPDHGDIVVCQDQTTIIKKPIVKRVIAIAGDTVEIRTKEEYRNGKLVVTSGDVIVNGKAIDEPYIYYQDIEEAYYCPRETVWELKEGEVFVMGDHRDASTDSREIGPISEDAILGRVLVRFFPINSFKIFN